MARNNEKTCLNALFDVTSGNFNSQKDHEDEVFLLENILSFVLKCTRRHKVRKIRAVFWKRVRCVSIHNQAIWQMRAEIYLL